MACDGWFAGCCPSIALHYCPAAENILRQQAADAAEASTRGLTLQLCYVGPHCAHNIRLSFLLLPVAAGASYCGVNAAARAVAVRLGLVRCSRVSLSLYLFLHSPEQHAPAAVAPLEAAAVLLALQHSLVIQVAVLLDPDDWSTPASSTAHIANLQSTTTLLQSNKCSRLVMMAKRPASCPRGSATRCAGMPQYFSSATRCAGTPQYFSSATKCAGQACLSTSPAW